MNKISQTIMESLDEVFTLYDFRGPWAQKEHKEIVLKQINEKFKSHLLQSQIKVIEEVIEERKIYLSEHTCESSEYVLGYNESIRDQISSLNQVKEEIENILK